MECKTYDELTDLISVLDYFMDHHSKCHRRLTFALLTVRKTAINKKEKHIARCKKCQPERSKREDSSNGDAVL